jgi:hypothetical protein
MLTKIKNIFFKLNTIQKIINFKKNNLCIISKYFYENNNRKKIKNS